MKKLLTDIEAEGYKVNARKLAEEANKSRQQRKLNLD